MKRNRKEKYRKKTGEYRFKINTEREKYAVEMRAEVITDGGKWHVSEAISVIRVSCMVQ